MRAPARNVLLVVCLCVVSSLGCQKAGWPPFTVWPFESYDDGDRITPVKRINQYRELASAADDKTAEEKQQVAQQLAATIQNEPDPLVRAEIVKTLAEYPGPTSDQVLLMALKDVKPGLAGQVEPSVLVRVAACRAWGKRGGPQAAAALRQALEENEDPDVRVEATRALGQLNSEDGATQALALALDDRDVAVQHRAMLSLESVTGKYYGKNVETWRQAMRDPSTPEVNRSLAERVRETFFY